jgi:UDP-N-acetyl-D-mannosaminuronic acid dehydrogenase
VEVVEPFVSELPPSLAGRARLRSPSEAVDAADIIVMLVDHNDFKAMPIPKDRLDRIIDTRGVWVGHLA